jgi:hypothetical protein
MASPDGEEDHRRKTAAQSEEEEANETMQCTQCLKEVNKSEILEYTHAIP